MVYTRWQNLKKLASYEAGQVRAGVHFFCISGSPAFTPVFNAVPIADALMRMAVPPWWDGSAPWAQARPVAT